MAVTVIFPGSFDPVHNGHMNLARHVARMPQVDMVWMMPSRRNPLKTHSVYASDSQRLEMLCLAASAESEIKVCDLELSLPYPSYTVNTLRELRRRYPGRDFRLLIGADNWLSFGKWRQADVILEEFGVMVYPRPGYEADKYESDQVCMQDGRVLRLEEVPLFPYSSTEVRKALADGIIPDDMLSRQVSEYILSHKLYNNLK